MFIKKLIVENFRNISFAELDFCSNVNIFFGNNAQGKTNLLESMAIALGRSFRNVKKSDVLPFSDNGDLRIRLFYETELIPNKLNEIVYSYCLNLKDTVKINDIPLKKAKDLYGEFKYVVFIPDNLLLIKGEPSLRRGYLDNIAVMQNKVHRKFQSDYKSALKQRYAAFLSGIYSHHKHNMHNMSVWDDILIKQGINLTYGRLKYLNFIKKYAVDLYGELSGGEKLDIIYKSDVFGEISGGENIDITDKNKLYEMYRHCLIKNDELLSGNGSAAKFGAGSKTSGAHRDDIVFRINGRNAKNYGSQGQLRSIAVALKLAEVELIRNFNKETPVVLLDEVLGELDEGRRHFIIKQFVNAQIFITSCNDDNFNVITGETNNIKVWNVDNGVFTFRG